MSLAAVLLLPFVEMGVGFLLVFRRMNFCSGLCGTPNDKVGDRTVTSACPGLAQVGDRDCSQRGPLVIAELLLNIQSTIPEDCRPWEVVMSHCGEWESAPFTGVKSVLSQRQDSWLFHFLSAPHPSFLCKPVGFNPL